MSIISDLEPHKSESPFVGSVNEILVKIAP